MSMHSLLAAKMKTIQSNLDYPDLDYPDFFCGPNMVMNVY